MKQYLEAGKIVNTHGLKGELKVMHWCDSAEFLCEFDTLYLDKDKTPMKVLKTRIHKGVAMLTFEGINDINIAETYKNKVLYIDRDEVDMDGLVFQQDIIGIDVFDEFLDKKIGTVKDILPMPTYDMFVIKGKNKEHLVPDVDAFVLEIDIENKLMTIKTIEGMIEDED
ncbi:MAG: ribosome maturation factor RimM [Clostridia bacterium]